MANDGKDDKNVEVLYDPSAGTKPEEKEKPEKSLGRRVLEGAGELGTGAMMGAGHTLNEIATLGGLFPLRPEVAKMRTEQITPKTGLEKAGFTGEQMAEWLLPTGAEEKGAALAARTLPKMGKFAPALGRVVAGTLESGVRNKLQGGEFGAGAEMGGVTGAGGELMRAAAPKVAESALAITNRMRGRGKTVGEAVLKEIPGVRPGTIAKEAGAKLGDLTKEMEAGVGEATQAGAKGTTQPAHDVLNDAIKSTPRNARGLLDKLKSLRDVLSLDQPVGGRAPRMTHTPDELLEIKRGIGKEIESWPPEWQKSKDVERVTQRMYGAIDKELDRLVPGHDQLNQRISSLIPAQSQAKKMSQGADISQRMLHRVAAHTGATIPSIAAGAYGYKEGGVPGAVAGALLPELMASPTGQMMAARAMRSPATTRLIRAGASGLMKRNGKSESKKQADEEE